MTKQAFDKIATSLREAADVAAIIAERDAAIRERDEEMKWVERYSEEDDRTRRAIGDEFTLVPPDGGDVKTHEAAESLRAALDEARAIIRETLWMARRYADGRGTYATSSYNDAARKALAAGIVEASSGKDEPIWASDLAGASYAGLSQGEHDAAVAYRTKGLNAACDDGRRAELARARAEALEDAARWHDAEVERLWPILQTTDDNGQVLRAVSDIERRYAMKASSAIRALKEAKR